MVTFKHYHELAHQLKEFHAPQTSLCCKQGYIRRYACMFAKMHVCLGCFSRVVQAPSYWRSWMMECRDRAPASYASSGAMTAVGWLEASIK